MPARFASSSCLREDEVWLLFASLGGPVKAKSLALLSLIFFVSWLRPIYLAMSKGKSGLDQRVSESVNS